MGLSPSDNVFNSCITLLYLLCSRDFPAVEYLKHTVTRHFLTANITIYYGSGFECSRLSKFARGVMFKLLMNFSKECRTINSMQNITKYALCAKGSRQWMIYAGSVGSGRVFEIFPLLFWLLIFCWWEQGKKVS